MRPLFPRAFLNMPNFSHVREIAGLCDRLPIVSIKPVFGYRTPKSDKPPGFGQISLLQCKKIRGRSKAIVASSRHYRAIFFC